jgi:hypothetical protein
MFERVLASAENIHPAFKAILSLAGKNCRLMKRSFAQRA